jgi:uncharacterized protein (PEP-CTERM system associated)
MADRSARPARLPGRALLPLLIGLAFAPSSRAEIKVTPTASVQETWTDNVNQATADQARSEFVTDFAPGLRLVDNNPRMQLAANYQFHKLAYSDNDAPNLRNSYSELQADLKGRVIEDLLFLDADATRHRQAVSAFGPQVNGSLYSSNNNGDVTTWRVSPYLARRIGSSADLVVRYTRDSVQANVVGYGNTKGDEANVMFSSAGEQRIGWNLYYDRQHLTDSLAGDSTTATAMGTLSWRVQPGFALNASAGYDDFDYSSLGGRTHGPSWNVGYSYTPSTRTSLTMSVGRRYFGQSRALKGMHRSRHTVWTVSYDESVTTSRQQFLLPSAVDTTSLLDSLFMSRFPDPVLRRQAVDAFIQSNGLPPSLANNINYLSNRFILQKQFMASVAMIGARSTLTLSAFDTRRNALSVQQADSQLLGNSQFNLNDNVHQRGLSGTVSYRMSSRTDAVATADVSRAVSLTTDIRTLNRSLRLGLHHQFQRKLQGVLELRHIQGSYSSDQTYTENAISATLSMMF